MTESKHTKLPEMLFIDDRVGMIGLVTVQRHGCWDQYEKKEVVSTVIGRTPDDALYTPSIGRDMEQDALLRAIATRYNAYPSLVEALKNILTPLRNNAAPFKLEYALGQVDKVWVGSDLMLDLLVALRAAGEEL